MAGRIPQQFIDDLLSRIDIIDVIEGYVPLRKAGRNHQALCPFHDEKTPSFTVSQEKQFYHCFGCGANGSAISFLMDFAGMDFVEAIEDLAARIGAEVPREGGTAQKDSGVTELYELMELIVRHYCKQLREHPEAQRAVDYLKARGITGQLAAEYELGFAPDTWDNLTTALGGSTAALKRLEKTGVIIPRENGGYYDRFRDRILFPIRDQRGRAIGLGGRVLGEGTPKYLNSPETVLFHKGQELYGLYQARKKNKSPEHIYVVEGYMDVLALAQNRIYNAVATLGTAVTSEHVGRLFKVSANIIFCFDGDTAGRQAAWRALEISLPLLREGRQVHFKFMPEGDDPDSYIRTHGADQFSSDNNQSALSDFLLDTLRQGIDPDKREDRALLVEKAMPYLAKMPSGALQELLLTDLANQSRLSVDILKNLLSDRKTVPRASRRFTPVQQTAPGQQMHRISKTIGLLLHHPDIARDQQFPPGLKTSQEPGIHFLLELLDFIQARPGITCAGILEHWRGTKFEKRLRELAATEDVLSESETTDEKTIQKEFIGYISKIESEINRQARAIESSNINSLDDLRRHFGKAKD